MISVLRNLYKFAIMIPGIQFISYICATFFVGSDIYGFTLLMGSLHTMVVYASNDEVLINIHWS
jgi:hypothetical protein